MSGYGGPSSRKRLIEIDDQLLALAQALLGDVTIRETVDTALRLLVQDREVIATTTGGAKVTEPAADLAVAMAIWSSVRSSAATPAFH